MASRAMPGIGLQAEWEYGEDGWNAGMDANLFALSVYTHVRASQTSPTTPSAAGISGEAALILGGADAGKIAVKDGSQVRILPGFVGMRAWCEADGRAYIHDGSTWTPDPASAMQEDILELQGRPVWPSHSLADVTASASLQEAAFGGGVTILATSNDPITLTIPAGLVDPQPLTVIQSGVGAVTVAGAAGVIVRSADDQVSTRARYSVISIIPTGADVYTIAGDTA